MDTRREDGYVCIPLRCTFDGTCCAFVMQATPWIQEDTKSDLMEVKHEVLYFERENACQPRIKDSLESCTCLPYAPACRTCGERTSASV